MSDGPDWTEDGPKVDRRWTEGGRDYGDFGDDAKM